MHMTHPALLLPAHRLLEVAMGAHGADQAFVGRARRQQGLMLRVERAEAVVAEHHALIRIE